MKLSCPSSQVICVSSAKLVEKRRAAKVEYPKHQEEGAGAADHRGAEEALRPWEVVVEARR